MIYRKNHVTRLSMYKGVVKRMRALGMNKVFSENIADALDLSASQVRKDFSVFGIKGKRKAGYSTEELIESFNRLLGKGSVRKAVIAGNGSLGKALAGYKGFVKERIEILAVFEKDETRVDTQRDVPVLSADQMGSFVSDNKIRLGIIAVPDEEAQGVADVFCENGIKGILNFAAAPLRTPEGVVVHDIDLNTALETLTFYVYSEEGLSQDKVVREKR